MEPELEPVLEPELERELVPELKGEDKWVEANNKPGTNSVLAQITFATDKEPVLIYELELELVTYSA